MRPEKDVYKVIQWATGSLGTKCIRAIQEVPYLELVGCWVSSDAKHGKDAGDIAGIEPIGVTATMHLEEICAIEADVVHYAPSLPDWTDVVALLESGKNVMSPLHFTFIGDDPEAIEMIEQAALKGGVSYYGTGIYPDWSAARMVLLTTALCHNIKKISFVEQNARFLEFGSPEPIVFDVMKFGQPAEEGHEPTMGALAFYTCLMQEMKNVAKAMGYEIERVEMEHDFTLATEDVRHPNYERYIAKGTIVGWKATFIGYIEGKPMMEYTSYHIAHAPAMDKDWDVTDDASYSVEIDAQPPMRTKWTSLDGEMTAAEACWEATAMNNMNVIPGVVSARPGIVCSTDMPQMLCSYKRLDIS